MTVALRLALAGGLSVVAAGCHGIEPNPTSPSSAPRSPVAATAIQIVVMPGELPIGGGTATLQISTVASGGTVVAPGVAVALRVDGGELSTAGVTTDATGHARLTWTGTHAATVTADAGTLSASTPIRVAAPVVLPPDVPPTRPPAPPAPEPLPPQPPAPPALTVTVSPNPRQLTVGFPTRLTADVTGFQSGETVLAYQWDWAGGAVFTANETSAGHTRQHFYTTDGVKTPVVVVRTSQGRSATATTNVFMVSP